MKPHTRTARATTTLEVETLEQRLTPDATTYVTGLYNDVLHRAPDPAGLAFWTGQLQAGQSRQQVAAAFWLSPEHRSLQVQQYYQRYLLRTADPAGLSVWTRVFTNGGQSEIQVQEGIIASQEYQNLYASNVYVHGGVFVNGVSLDLLHTANPNVRDFAYLVGLYSGILGRPPDETGLAYWYGQLQSGSSSSGDSNNRSPRQRVALGILTSDEARLLVINQDYNTLLHRAPDSAGQQSWLNQLRSSENPELLTGQSSGNNENDNQGESQKNFLEHINDQRAASQESVAVDFLSSPEYIATH